MIIDTICAGCEIFAHVNDLGLCADCNAKLDRDMIRARDWDYSSTAFFTPDDQRETLREQIIREYGSKNELIADEKPRKRKNKRSHSRNTKRKREIAANAIRNYDTGDVLKSARDYLEKQSDEWVNFSTVSQHLYERFYKLKAKRLGQSGKKYKSLLKFLQDYPSMFVIYEDNQKRGVFWIRLA
jgi:hypothetical protein